MSESDSAIATIKQIRTAEIHGWSRERKVKFLRNHGWRNVGGNRWEHTASGVNASLSHACVFAAMADLEESA